MKKIVLFLCVWLQVGLMAQDIDILYTAPTAEEFVHLRAVTGLPPRSVAGAQKGLKNSLFWVTLRHHGNLIGMGRAVGDGGTVVQITDIAVHPNYQRKGFGKLIFHKIQEYISKEVPDEAFVCLFAEKQAVPFYESEGFKLLGEKWPGMYWDIESKKTLRN